MKKLIFLLLSAISLAQITFSQEIKTEEYCEKIGTKIDKFSGVIKYNTPLLEQISLFKTVETGKDTLYYMRLSTIGSTPSTGEGVIILFENGAKISKNDKTKVRVNNNAQYEHSAFIALVKEDIELIKKFNITDCRLYIFDMEIKDPIQYRAYMICLDSK